MKSICSAIALLLAVSAWSCSTANAQRTPQFFEIDASLARNMGKLVNAGLVITQREKELARQREIARQRELARQRALANQQAAFQKPQRKSLMLYRTIRPEQPVFRSTPYHPRVYSNFVPQDHGFRRAGPINRSRGRVRSW